jgi:uracil-DNA glycosylase
MATAYRDIALREMGIAQWVRKGLVDVPTNDAPIDAPIEARSPAIDSENILSPGNAHGLGVSADTVAKRPIHGNFEAIAPKNPMESGVPEIPRSAAPASARAPLVSPAARPIASPAAEPIDASTLNWDALQSTVNECTRCGLCASRKQTVFGVGNRAARWMVIGEAPGAEEDATGEPFVGQAGKLLDAMLAAIGLSRANDVYIANVLKCRPPGNRNPEPAEVAQCWPYLQRQIALVNPALIVLMGRFAAQAVLRSDSAIAALRGRVHSVEGRPAIVTYHPAYLLRTLADKSKAWQDLCLAQNTMKETA